jgi:hypothetical protein
LKPRMLPTSSLRKKPADGASQLLGCETIRRGEGPDCRASSPLPRKETPRSIPEPHRSHQAGHTPDQRGQGSARAGTLPGACNAWPGIDTCRELLVPLYDLTSAGARRRILRQGRYPRQIVGGNRRASSQFLLLSVT